MSTILSLFVTIILIIIGYFIYSVQGVESLIFYIVATLMLLVILIGSLKFFGR